MLQQAICHKCGAILHDCIKLKPTEKIVVDYDGRCATCGKKLSYIPIDFEVKLVRETSQLSPFEAEKTIRKGRKR